MRVLNIEKGVPITGLAYSPDSTTLAVAGAAKTGDICVSLWGLADAVVRRTTTVAADEPKSPALTFSPDGRFLAVSATPNAVLDFEDASEPLPLRALNWHSYSRDRMCFGRGGNVIFGRHRGELAALDLRTGKKAIPPKFTVPRKADFIHEKDLLAGTVTGHDLALLIRYSLPISWRQGGRIQPHVILVLDSNSQQRQHRIEFIAKAYTVTKLGLERNGRYVAVLVAKSVVVWDATSGEESATLGGGKKQPADFAFSADGRYLGVLFQDSVSLYDTASWTVAKTYSWKVGKLVSLAFSPDGATAAVGSDKGKVVVFDLE